MRAYSLALIAVFGLQLGAASEAIAQPTDQTWSAASNAASEEIQPDDEQTADAQPADPQTQSTPMTLKECMDYAVSNSTKTRIQLAAIGDARLARRDAVMTAFTPSVNGSNYAYYNFGRAVDPQTNTYVNTTSFHNSYGVSAGITLFDGFSAVNNLKITRTSLAIGYSQEDQIEADICLATMEAYYNLVYYTQLADTYKAQVQTAKKTLEKARRQEELGQKGHSDVVEMDSNLADKEYLRITTINKMNDARITLEDVMFWSEDRPLEIDSSVPDKLEDALSLDEPVATDEMIDFAQDKNPAARIARMNLLNARREWSTAKWRLFPTLSAYAGWSTTYYTYPGSSKTSDPFRAQFKNNGGEYVELSLSIPIFSGLKRHSAIARKKNAVAKATAEYDQKMRDIDAEVRRAVQDRDGAFSALEQAQRKADVQEEAYSFNIKKLEQGLISPIEYQAASNNYLEAKAQRLNSMFTYFIKRSVVSYYNGVDYADQRQLLSF